MLNDIVMSTPSPLNSGNSMSSNSISNGFAELVQLAVNFSSLWAPAAILNSDSSINSILESNSSDFSANLNTSVQLVDCVSSLDCFNWINYTQNENNQSITNNSAVPLAETVDSIHHISANITLSPLTSYSLNNETFTTTFATLLTQNTTNFTTIILEPDLRIHHPFLAVILAIICVIVVFGNSLTMLSVYRERYLHTVTNYFVASLAAADCLVGAIVMPFSVVHEVMNKWWIFGQDWCDLWHSFDVLASSASILNLCVISLDRYWAITDPMTYPTRMTPNKAGFFIACVWLCSALISFPAILWWRAVQKEPAPPFRCLFTDDVGYLVFSSTISFYGPLMVMVFTYYRIYVVASRQTRSLKLGAKQIQSSCDSGDNNAIVLRMHRGGRNVANNTPITPRQKYSGDSSDEHHIDFINSDENGIEKGSSIRSARTMKANWSVGRRLAKLAKERKAAKTLGIVMGVFILCWLPFFISNVLMGICGESCVFNPDLVLSIFTWLGWLNSAMNPAIYACWSKDFRRAFRKILCSCCSSQNRRNKALKQNRFSYGSKRPKTPANRKSEEIVLNTLEVRSNSCSGNTLQKEILSL